jgi:hypothetical protein
MVGPYCTVVYKPSKSTPAHLTRGLNVKGIEVQAGVPVRVSPEQAGMLQAAAPEGTITVTEGEPTPWDPRPRTLKQAARRAAERGAQLAADPVGGLDKVPTIPPDLRAVLDKGGKTALDAIAKMGMQEASWVAIFCRLGGREELAEIAARRAHELSGPGPSLTVQP